ncbi:MAG TPA: ribonuclease III [Candidatus Acidoferrales bacterium]|nr:ribonuclease III [Candidatus Acidoferrales bacterium]
MEDEGVGGGRGIRAPASSFPGKEAHLEIAGHRFSDAEVIETALTHSSYLHEHPGTGARDFERLEFLGDAVVDLVVGEELYRRFPEATEGQLTSLRASLVSSTPLAAIARQLGLPQRARLGRGEEESGGRSRIGLAASLYESLIGAVYVDAGFERAKRMVLDTMGAALDAIADAPMKSAKSLLQEWAQSEKLPLPTYRVLEATGPEHRRDFVVEVEVDGRAARGSGASKRDAQEAAAAELLRMVSA